MDNLPASSPNHARVYLVTVRSIDYGCLLVEAKSVDEAMELAAHVDPSYFHMTLDSEWELESAEGITDYDPELLAPPEAYESL